MSTLHFSDTLNVTHPSNPLSMSDNGGFEYFNDVFDEIGLNDLAHSLAQQNQNETIQMQTNETEFEAQHNHIPTGPPTFASLGGLSLTFGSSASGHVLSHRATRWGTPKRGQFTSLSPLYRPSMPAPPSMLDSYLLDSDSLVHSSAPVATLQISPGAGSGSSLKTSSFTVLPSAKRQKLAATGSEAVRRTEAGPLIDDTGFDVDHGDFDGQSSFPSLSTLSGMETHSLDQTPEKNSNIFSRFTSPDIAPPVQSARLSAMFTADKIHALAKPAAANALGFQRRLATSLAVDGSKLGALAHSVMHSVKMELVDSDAPLHSSRPAAPASAPAAAAAADESDSEGDAPRRGKSGGGSKRVQKGLRHFSVKVCEKVEALGSTTYNQVADQLVSELRRAAESNPDEAKNYDEKNIRRRVYDALNVLMSIGIIEKDKKQISWIGLPTGIDNTAQMLKQERDATAERVKQKRADLKDRLVQLVCLKNLLERNADSLKAKRSAEELSDHDSDRIPLRFLMISTRAHGEVHLQFAHDKSSVMAEASCEIRVAEDMDILRQLNLDKIEPWDLYRVIPKDLVQYFPQELIERADQGALPPATPAQSAAPNAPAQAATSAPAPAPSHIALRTLAPDRPPVPSAHLPPRSINHSHLAP